MYIGLAEQYGYQGEIDVDRPEIYERLNGAAAEGIDIFTVLRDLPVEVVADVMLDIPEEYEYARKAIPRMAEDAIQDLWTGSHGHRLLFESCAFTKAIELGYLKYTGKDLRGKKILDYGCGWGRLIRLMYAFSPPENIFGCDPWDRSIDLCKASGINANLAICDYLPKSVPFSEKSFDLAYAFSVFTHLSEETAKTVLSAIHKSIASDGLLAITIRPASYWYVHQYGDTPINLEKLRDLHWSNKYAFVPHNSATVDRPNDSTGVQPYGDASFSLEYIKREWKDWTVVGTDVSLLDPYQTIVFLKPLIT
jgi:SAM-dependent methyltransferase